MDTLQKVERLERHVLVTAIWMSSGMIAASLLHYGFSNDSPAFELAGFGAVGLGFVGHILVNLILRTTFGSGEIALALTLYAVALVTFGLAVLTVSGLSQSTMVVTSIGLISLAAIVVFYMTIVLGVRRAFNSFDVIREFKAGKAQESET